MKKKSKYRFIEKVDFDGDTIYVTQIKGPSGWRSTYFCFYDKLKALRWVREKTKEQCND